MVYNGRKERDRQIQTQTAGKSGEGECEEAKSLSKFQKKLCKASI